LADYSSLSEQLKAGKLRPIAATSPIRIEPLPDVRTVAELGYKELEVDLWVGVFAPANKTPQELVSRLASRFAAAVQAPDVKMKLAIQGPYSAVACGEDFGAILRKAE
jgi:tripartite-type tricarboxylate transporter receptor subunit TctC